jgi:hypothetical protein
MEIEKEEKARRGFGWGPIVLFFILALLLVNNLGWHEATITGKVAEKEIVGEDGNIYRIVGDSHGKQLVQEYLGRVITVTGKVKDLGREKLIQVSSYSQGNSNQASG